MHATSGVCAPTNSCQNLLRPTISRYFRGTQQSLGQFLRRRARPPPPGAPPVPVTADDAITAAEPDESVALLVQVRMLLHSVHSLSYRISCYVPLHGSNETRRQDCAADQAVGLVVLEALLPCTPCRQLRSTLCILAAKFAG